MYDVRLNGRTATSVPSYEKAVAASKSSLSVVVENVRERAAAIPVPTIPKQCEPHPVVDGLGEEE